MSKRWSLLAGGFAGLATAAVMAIWMGPDLYESSGAVRLLSPRVPGSLMPAPQLEFVQRRADSLLHRVLSRTSLANIVVSEGLNPSGDGTSAEHLAARMKTERVRVSADRAPGVPPAWQFRVQHENAAAAQRAAARLMDSFVQALAQAQADESAQTALVLTAAVQAAAMDWDAAQAAAGSSSERKSATIAAARRHWEYLDRLSREQKVLGEMRRRQQSWLAEILEPASLPAFPNRRRWLWLPAGFFAGLLLSCAQLIGRARRKSERQLRSDSAAAS